MAPGQPSMHKTFKEIKIHTAKCDQCNKHNSATIYRCEECSEQCCTPCWNQQGDDGKHLLNHALTVTIPASEAEKRRPTKRKPTRVVTKGAKKIAITNKKVEKYPVRRKVVDDDDFDDTEDDVEMGGGPVQIATAANKTTQIKKKQLKARLQMPSLHEDSSDPDVEFGPIPHFRDTTQHAMKRVGSGPSATPRRPAQGSKEQAQKKNNVAVHEGYTTDDDSPVLHVPPKATSTSSKVSFKVSNANKRKRSGSSLEDQNTFRDHHSASSRKKARTGVTPRNTEVTMNASSYPQALTNTEETEAEIREHAKNLLLFAQGIQHSSPTPSPPITKTTGPLNTEANNRPGLTDSNTARSSSPFADLPLWPPAPTSKTAAVSSTSPPSHDYYELTAARQAQDQTTQSPAPREGMWNRTWFPTDADDRAKANAAYHAGVSSGLAINSDARPATAIETSETLIREPDLTDEEAVEMKKAHEEHASRQTARGQTTTGEVVVIEVVETVTRTTATPLRKGMAHVKEVETTIPSSRT